MALTITQLALRDSNSTGSLGSITPTAGGVLLCFVETATNGVTFTHEGTLSATWVSLYSYNSPTRPCTLAVWYATTYSGSGTVDLSQSAGTWNSGGVAIALDAGVINTTSPIKQSKNLTSVGAVLTLDAATSYGTWSAVAGAGATTGGGYTILGNSSAWDSIGHGSNTTGGQTFTANGNSAIVTVELNTATAAGGSSGAHLGDDSGAGSLGGPRSKGFG